MWHNEPGECINYCMKRIFNKKLTTLSGGNISIKDGKEIYITPKVNLFIIGY